MSGRNRDAYWEARRRRAAKPRPDARAAAIAEWKERRDAARAALAPAPQTQRRWTDTIQPHWDYATIKGERGRCYIDFTATLLPKTLGEARVFVRWSGTLKAGSVIEAGYTYASDGLTLKGVRWRVLHFTPMGPGDDAALIVCKKFPLTKTKKKRRPAARRRTR